MVKFAALGPDGKTVLGLGLTDENLRRLKAGEPIAVLVAEVIGAPSPPANKMTVMLFWGKDEDAIKALFEENGLIGPGTTVVDRRGLKARD